MLALYQVLSLTCKILLVLVIIGQRGYGKRVNQQDVCIEVNKMLSQTTMINEHPR